MRRGIAADAPLSDAGEERLSEEDRRALKMIEELFPGEYRAAKREVAAAIASDAPSSLGGLAAILSCKTVFVSDDTAPLLSVKPLCCSLDKRVR